MDIKEQLEHEVEEYNKLAIQIADLEAQKLHRMGRITVFQELLKDDEKPNLKVVEDSNAS